MMLILVVLLLGLVLCVVFFPSLIDFLIRHPRQMFLALAAIAGGVAGFLIMSFLIEKSAFKPPGGPVLKLIASVMGSCFLANSASKLTRR